jgi:hypothetical protein
MDVPTLPPKEYGPNDIPPGKTDNVISELDIADYANKYSDSIYLVPPRIQRMMLWIAGEYWMLDESLLLNKCCPTATVKMLRINFWNEYYAAVRENRMMEMINVYRSVCSSSVFYSQLSRREACIWVFRAMKDYTTFMEEQLHRGLQRIDEILSLPIAQNGKINTSTANLILRTIQMVENRVKGAVVQKHEHKSLNVSVNAMDVQPKDLIELERKIALLEGGEVLKISDEPIVVSPEEPKPNG